MNFQAQQINLQARREISKKPERNMIHIENSPSNKQKKRDSRKAYRMVLKIANWQTRSASININNRAAVEFKSESSTIKKLRKAIESKEREIEACKQKIEEHEQSRKKYLALLEKALEEGNLPIADICRDVCEGECTSQNSIRAVISYLRKQIEKLETQLQQLEHEIRW